MTTPPPQGQNPYAQQPAPTAPQQGQPQGQPPFQGAPFQGQGMPTPPPPAPAKRAGKKVARIVGIIAIAVVVGLVKWGIGWWFTSTDAETTSVGACMHNDGNDAKPDLNEVDCSSSQAQYKVVQKFDGTSDDSKCESVQDATISYYQIGNGHNVVLCLKDV